MRVLLFQDFGQLADQNALNAPPLSSLKTAPPPTAAQAAAIQDVATRRAAAVKAAADRVRAANAAPPPVPTATPLEAATQPAAPAAGTPDEGRE